MDKKLKQILNQARERLEKKKFDEGLAILKEWPDDIPEIENIRNKLQQAKLNKINLLLKALDKAWQ